MTSISIYECKICGQKFKNIYGVIDHAVEYGHYDFREIPLTITLYPWEILNEVKRNETSD